MDPQTSTTATAALADAGDPSTTTVEALAHELGSNLASGLSAELAARKLQDEGPNELTKQPKPTLLMLFAMQLTGFIIILLLTAAVASIVVNATGPRASDPLQYTTGMAIFVIVILNAGIAAWTEHKAGDALEALSKMTQASIGVLRGGCALSVDTTTVVRGDIVILNTGDVVPADMRLIEARDIKVSEMALTGEPDDVSKSARMKPKRAGEPEKLTPENMVFSGCSVTNGTGRGIIVATGMGTRIGRIAQLIAEKNGGKPKKRCFCLPDISGDATPLQQSLEKLGGRIGVLAILVCIIVFIIGVSVGRTDPLNRDGKSWLYMILISVTLAVAAIPEGIPLCVTISLSIGCKEMVHKNVLVRKLAAVETLGSASVICSDKTGTLTEGKMTMVGMWSGGVPFEVTGKGFDPNSGGVARPGGGDASGDVCVRSSLFSALLCCNTTLSKTKDPESGEERWEPKGNSSEAPLVVAARKVGLSEGLAAEHRRALEVPFSSSRKMMLTVSDVSGRSSVCEGGMALPRGASFLAVCKGAPNYVLDYCTQRLNADGLPAPLTEEGRAEVLRAVDDYSSRALRVLAVAARSFERLPFDPADEDLSADSKLEQCRSGMCLLGLVASIDPERDGVKESVQRARGAGIRVVMITGDYVMTAVAIARNVNILQAGDDEQASAVDCKGLRPDGDYLPKDGIDRLTASVRVFARAKPEDKLEIVKSLQRQGLVTAMTGDGVNDAPALNQADIGVAMGIQGTEVAKGASDMILTDDNFCSIVAAVEKGRTIYAGIQKFVAFIMSVHIAEVLQIFVCIVSGLPVMRSPLQILFLILVTDLPPSIALGMEPGDKTILEQRPRPKEEPVVLGFMWLSQVMNGAALTLVIVGVYIAALHNFCNGEILQDNIDSVEGLMDARTVAFISLVFSENVRSYCSRSFDKPIWRNMWGNVQMQRAILMAEISMLVAVFVPGLSTEILELRGLEIGWFGWVLALAGPVGTLVLCEACKLITAYQMRRHQHRLALKQKEAEAAVANGQAPGVNQEPEDNKHAIAKI
mmetsp:Transcript_97923/g.277218  ORF Transcript_97923/g.277218 Transcript_97923/m.277218 type:complete len:1038 (-) Transcript_97923:318-3431(-)